MMQSEILKHFRLKDPVIYKVMENVNFERWINLNIASQPDYFYSLCSQIINQQLSGKAADSILKKVEGVVVPLTPENILLTTDEQLRSAGLSRAKVTYLKNIAEAFESGLINQTALESWEDETVIEHLTQIKGIGRWTAEMFLMFTLRRPNVFSFGDLGLKKGIAKVYGFEMPTQPQIEKIVTKWSPYKTFGAIALWHSLEI